MCGNNVNVLKCVCAWTQHMICASRALKHGVSDSRVLTTPVRHRNRIPQPSKLKHQKKLVCFIQPRKRSLHIIQWWDVLTLRSVCISHCATHEWALALFGNNHRACVLKRNTLELIIHWKHNTRIYSLCHLLCNQPDFLYISHFIYMYIYIMCVSVYVCVYIHIYIYVYVFLWLSGRELR